MKTAKELLNEHPELTLIFISAVLEQAHAMVRRVLSDPLSVVADSEFATEELLLEALKHPNGGVRYAAVINEKVTGAVLRAALEDIDQLVRDAAERQLKRRKNDD